MATQLLDNVDQDANLVLHTFPTNQQEGVSKNVLLVILQMIESELENANLALHYAQVDTVMLI